jgi:hypothetical protein
MYAEHITAERAKLNESNGRRVHEYELIPARENHLMDTTVGCLVAASTIGVSMDGMASQAKPKREPMKLSDIQKAKRGR